MILGYGRPQTDLPGAISTGLQLGQRSKQMMLDEEERKRQAVSRGLEQEYREGMLELGERQETRQEERLGFDIDQAKIDLGTLNRSLDLQEQVIRNAERKQRFLELSTTKYHDAQMEDFVNQVAGNKNNGVPGRQKFQDSKTMQEVQEYQGNFSNQMAMVKFNHAKEMETLLTPYQRDMQTKHETEAKIAREEELKMEEHMTDKAIDLVENFDGDILGLMKSINSMETSGISYMEKLAVYMKPIAQKSSTPSDLLVGLVGGMDETGKTRIAEKLLYTVYGDVIPTEAQLDAEAAALAEGSDAAPDPDKFPSTITMREYYNDSMMLGNLSNFKRYLKDTKLYASNQLESIQATMGVIRSGKLPKGKKKEEAKKVEKPEVKKAEVKKAKSGSENKETEDEKIERLAIEAIGTSYKGPKTSAEFIATLNGIENDDEARKYYNQWVDSWQ